MNTDRIISLAMNDNGFIFDPSSGYSYSTNQVGLSVLTMLKSGKTKDEIISELTAEYEVSEDNCASDLEHFFLILEALDLVEQ